MDGTYLTNHNLVVNSTTSSLATDVTVLYGINRDEIAVNLSPSSYPSNTTTSFTAYLDATAISAFGAPPGISTILGLTAATPSHPFPGLAPNLFNNTATPAQIFNATMRLATDWLYACNSLATAYSAARNGAFKETFFFEFNRTYSPRGYTQPWCDPPATPAHPYGNPAQDEYFKCHAGEQMIVFGTEARAGVPDRDGLDVPFMQLVVDYWAAFARKGDPNPDKRWLRARGYEGTLAEVERAGRWEAVAAEKPTMRVLQWGGRQVPLGQGHAEVCAGLGAPLDKFELK